MYLKYKRYPPTDEHWLELQRRLGRWGGGETWRRLEHLGAIAKTEEKFRRAKAQGDKGSLFH
jgi:hypothetical protein